MTLVRNAHWAERAYHDFILARGAMPFVWGGNDCALFAADGIEAITGVDIAEEFRGRYTDEAGAWATVKAVTGGSTVADAAAHCAAKAGMAELVHPLMAQRGDLVTLEDGGRVIAGLVHLDGRFLVSVGQDGLLKMPITAVQRAWHY